MIFGRYANYIVDITACPMLIYLMDLKTQEVSTIPGSEGLWSPRWSPDGKKIVAMTRIGDALMIYETTSGKWSELSQTLDRSMGPAMVKGWEGRIFWEQIRPIQHSHRGS